MAPRLKPGSLLIGLGVVLALWQALFGVVVPMEPGLADLAGRPPRLDAAWLTRVADLTVDLRWPLLFAIVGCILVGGVRRRRSQRAARGGLDHRSAFLSLAVVGVGVLVRFWSPATFASDPRQLAGAAGVALGALGFAWASGWRRRGSGGSGGSAG